MTTAYTFNATIASAPARRPLSPLTPKAAAPPQRHTRASARICVMSAAAVSVVAALLLIPIGHPATKNAGCIHAADLHSSPVRLGVPPLAVERDWHTHALPVGRQPSAGCPDHV
jgi:hypothetical protein